MNLKNHSILAQAPDLLFSDIEKLISEDDFSKFLLHLSESAIRKSQRNRLGLVHAVMRLDNAIFRRRILNELVNLGADVDCHNIHRQSPLHESAKRFDLGAMSLLISMGANVDNQNVSGDTPLHITATVGRIRTAVCLIEAGAKTIIRNDAGKTFLDVAAPCFPSFVEHIDLFLSVKRTLAVLETKLVAFDEFSNIKSAS